MYADDEQAFGPDVWVYCRQHLRPHTTGWCTVSVDQKEALEARDYQSAHAECVRRGFKLFSSACATADSPSAVSEGVND